MARTKKVRDEVRTLRRCMAYLAKRGVHPNKLALYAELVDDARELKSERGTDRDLRRMSLREWLEMEQEGAYDDRKGSAECMADYVGEKIDLLERLGQVRIKS